jgi:serine/threonine protein kinase
LSLFWAIANKDQILSYVEESEFTFQTPHSLFFSCHVKELLEEYQPLVTFHSFPQYKGRLLNLPAAEKKSQIASMIKSAATSCHELQTCAPIYMKSLESIVHVPEISVLVHGDIKIENMLLDPKSKSLRLSDLDALAIVRPGKYGTVPAVTSRMFAPPGTQQPIPAALYLFLRFTRHFAEFARGGANGGSISDRVDSWMIGVMVFRFFSHTSQFDSIMKVFWTPTIIARALDLEESDEVVKILVACRSMDPKGRPTIDQLLDSLKDPDADLLARTLDRWSEESYPEEAQLAKITTTGDANMMQAIGARRPFEPAFVEAPTPKVQQEVTIAQLGQSITMLAQNRQQEILAVADDMIAQESPASRLKILRRAMDLATANATEMAAAVLERFVQRFLSSDADLNAARIAKANSKLKSVFIGRVSELDPSDVQTVVSGDLDVLTSLGRLAVGNKIEPADEKNMTKILVKYSCGRTSGGRLAARLLIGLELFDYKTNSVTTAAKPSVKK